MKSKMMLLVLWVMACVGCFQLEAEQKSDRDDDTRGTPRTIVLSAAFTRLAYGALYDMSGEMVRSVDCRNGDGTITVQVPPGEYYLTLQDDLGNALFDLEGKMWFAPKSDVGEIELIPHSLPDMAVQFAVLTVPEPGITMQGMHTFSDAWSARNRVVWEAAKAMAGPASATGYNWSAGGEALANYEAYQRGYDPTYSYVGEDLGAWKSMLGAYPGKASCWYWDDPTCLVGDGYSPENPSQYTCQNLTCPSTSGKYRGGQCKFFTNLILYRSGVYHQKGSWNSKTLPSDSDIPSKAKLLTSGSMALGDVIRRTTTSGPHAAIIVKILSSTQAVVFDSNWIGSKDGNYDEAIGSHVMNIFTSGDKDGKISDLDTYYDLDCVYDKTQC